MFKFIIVELSLKRVSSDNTNDVQVPCTLYSVVKVKLNETGRLDHIHYNITTTYHLLYF